MSPCLPDVNVLLALTLKNHQHTKSVHGWYEQEKSPTLVVCRVSQLSFLRLLTSVAVAGADLVPNNEAWSIYSELVERRHIAFMEEPAGLDGHIASLGGYGKPAPKLWADAYLAAFAVSAGLRVVTFDRALARIAPNSVLLREQIL